MSDPIVIVGAGLAGYGLARALRRLDPAVPIRLVSQDDADYYYKPAISAAYASGKTADQLMQQRGPELAAQLGVELSAHAEAISLDADGRRLRTRGGDIAYRSLVLASGARSRPLPLVVSADAMVHQVNHLDDYRRLRKDLDGKTRLAILGAGLIGCEFANDLAQSGVAVDVFDPGWQPLSRLLPSAAGAALARALEGIGVRWHLGEVATAVERAGQALRVRCGEGHDIEVDVVLCAVGLVPNTGWLSGSGVTVGRGVLVDDTLRTSVEDVYALGDCAEYPQGWLPFVAPIHHAARVLAATLLGTPTPLRLPPLPVKVKTPTLPVSVLPPPRNAVVEWTLERSGGDLAALARDESGRLRGFALLGATDRQPELLSQLAALEAA